MLLGKRKRARSECSSEVATLPLTAENLARLEAMTSTAKKTTVSRSSAGNSGASDGGGGSGSSSRSARSGASTRRSSGRAASDLFRLTFFSIRVQHDRQTWPLSLTDLVDSLRDTPYEPLSPNASRVVSVARVAADMSEADGINALEPYLIGVDALSLRENSMDKVRLCRNANLERAYVPQPEDQIAKDILLPLEQPQPDTLLGYLNYEEATRMDLSPPLTAQEELHSRTFRICAGAQYPFFTCQWKSPKNMGTHYQARIQCARDGAAIVHFLHHFYSSVEDQDPDPADTCHFSATCDMESIVIYVHWRSVTPEGVVRIEMQRIYAAFCWEDDRVADVRRFIRNLVAHAQGPRLDRIKAALAILAAKYDQPKACLIRFPQHVTVAPSKSASAATMTMPPTPTDLPKLTDLPLSRPRKRARTEEVDEVSFGAIHVSNS